MAIHEDVVELIREARPHIDLLHNVNLLASRRPPEEQSAKYRARVEHGIPVRDPKWDRRHPPTGEATRAAQIWWASKIIAAKEARVA